MIRKFTLICVNSEFNDILPAIAALDADVITIETSRSDMELLDAFVKFNYPNDIGPGVYDIHSPRVPTAGEIEHLLRKALKVIPKETLMGKSRLRFKNTWLDRKLSIN